MMLVFQTAISQKHLALILLLVKGAEHEGCLQIVRFYTSEGKIFAAAAFT